MKKKTTRRSDYRRGAQTYAKPAGEIRQSQLLTTYGPGALVDLVDDAVIIGGLEYWDFARGERVLEDNRLRDALARRLEPEWKTRKLAVDKAFKEPPAGDSRDPNIGMGIRVFEFPRWFVCQNPRCRALQGSRSLERSGKKYRHRCDVRTDGKDEWDCVPVRFVGACRSGHIQDFPWKRWVHQKKESTVRCEGSRLRLWEGSSGDFSEVVVECATCETKRRLTEALLEEGNPECEGERPWLGKDAREPGCGERLRLLIRTASNSYFSQVESSLSIRETEETLRGLVRERWKFLENATAQNLAVLRTALADLAELAPYSDEDVLAVVDALRNRKQDARSLREAEYRTFRAATDEPPGDTVPKGKDFHAVRLPGAVLPKGVDRIVLVKRLRELRVQVGFTRLEPPSPSLQGEFDLRTRRAELGQNTNWLPASEVNGEGIFIALDEQAVRDWEDLPAVDAREKELRSGFDAWVGQLYGKDSKREQAPPEFPGARFFLLHSISHMLITELALDCGYPASALRERLYCAPRDAALPMAGILLMTGSSGAEGTLGGLVEEGRRIGRHIHRALEHNALCSNDPVCAYHSPAEDLAERYLEGAACHGCLFVAECSCERFNKYLDRALVVPTIGHEGIAFFGGDG